MLAHSDLRRAFHLRQVLARLSALPEVALAREAAALIQAGAIDGLSIGYRTIRAERDGKGRRVLAEVELWEVSLVTFPMLPEAKVGRKDADDLREVAALFVAAAEALRV